MAIPHRILRRYSEEIEKIHVLDEEPFRALVLALEEATLTVNTRTLASELAPKVSAVSQSELEEILPALLSFCLLRDQSEASTAESAEDVSHAVQADDEAREHTKARFIKLLNLDSLNVIAKSGSLQINRERWLLRVQLLTDIRPVFGINPENPPRAAMVAYTLKLTYLEDGAEREFFVAVESDDISDLLDQLERANSKTEGLRSVLAAAEVPYVDDGYREGKGGRDAG